MPTANVNLAMHIKKGRPGWDRYFLDIAKVVSTRADCRRRQVGCVIVDENHRIISTGYNGAPAGDPGCLDGNCPRGLLSYEEAKEFSNYDTGPGKCISIHAEVNAVIYARRDLRGCTAYITDKPCPTCDKVLRGAGIKRIVWIDMGESYEAYRRYLDSEIEPRCGHFSTKHGLKCIRPDGHLSVGPHGNGGIFWE